MNNLKIESNKGARIFSVLYLLFFVIGAILIAWLNRGDILLFINGKSNVKWDFVVTIITDIGLGSLMAILGVLLVFWKIRYAIIALTNLIFVSIFTNSLKSVFRDHWFRPLHYFLYDDLDRFIYTTELNYFSSFPSGHTMTIFAMMSLLAYFSKNRILGIVFFCVAVLVGFSRIYLLQHFFMDVYAGSFLGVVCTIISIWIFDKQLSILKNGFWNNSIIRIIHK